VSRHAFITGAGSGIGEVISRQLHAEGYRVSLVGRRIEPLQTLSTSLGSGSQAVAGDVTDRARAWSRLSPRPRERFGDIEILVNSAGMAPTAPFSRLDFS
jgi:NADP-dependent 3-hydroxy acid dehydrogenase YdfG